MKEREGSTRVGRRVPGGAGGGGGENDLTFWFTVGVQRKGDSEALSVIFISFPLCVCVCMRVHVCTQMHRYNWLTA